MTNFVNFHKEVEQNTEKLQLVEFKLIYNPHSPTLNNWHFWLIKQRENLLLFNKCYWGNLPRKKCLVDCDRNSHFSTNLLAIENLIIQSFKSRMPKVFSLRSCPLFGRNVLMTFLPTFLLAAAIYFLYWIPVWHPLS